MTFIFSIIITSHELDLNDIIENYKNYNKRAKKNNKKSKEEGSN
jgi:hypothetical protein